MIKWFRYVCFVDIPAYLSLGWEWDGMPLHAPHGCYAALMEWCGQGEPREPERAS
jgi:hypothetical protein